MLYCKWLVKRLDENIRILQQFKINIGVAFALRLSEIA